MDDLDERQNMMQRDVLMVAIAGISLINGMHFSPYFDPVAILLRPFLAGTFLGTPLVFLYITSIFVSLMSLMIAGIPAALYERAKGLKETTPGSLKVWLAAIVLVSLPALVGLTG